MQPVHHDEPRRADAARASDFLHYARGLSTRVIEAHLAEI
jgi:hypothetical protein